MSNCLMPAGDGMVRLGRRPSLRLPDYDYALPGAYFVTICTHNRVCLFGHIRSDAVSLSGLGEIVNRAWLQIPQHFPSVRLDSFVVMPNHVHGVLMLDESREAPAPPGDGDQQSQSPAKAPRTFGSANAGSLSVIVRSFKSASTRQINLARRSPGKPVWQRSFYDHVIRDETDLHAIRQYVQDNPLRWALDEENPARRV